MLSKRSDGQYWHYTEWGSYPLVYVTANMSKICSACANGQNGSEASETHEDEQWRLVDCAVYWESAPLQCDHCGADIESVYGDPNASEGGVGGLPPQLAP